MSRAVHWVIVHCSDSDVPAHDNIETITKWHTLPLAPPNLLKAIEDGKKPKSELLKFGRGFKAIGYHYFIAKDGAVYKGRDEDEIGAHASGHNKSSIGICLSGKKEFTEAQFKSLETLLIDICSRHDLEKKDILAHCDVNAHKTCPNFDLHALLASWQWH